MGRKLPKANTGPNTRETSETRDDDVQSVTSTSTASTMITVNISRIHMNDHKTIEEKAAALARAKRIPLASKQRCRTGGRRGQRREDNTRELTKIYEEMRNEDNDEFVRFIEPVESKFSKVLEDPELRKTWQVFTSLPGDAQDRFISYIDQSVSARVEAKQARTAECVTVKSKFESETKLDKEEEMNDSAVDLGESYSFTDNNGKIVEECERLREARRCYMNIQKKIRANMRRDGPERVPFHLIAVFEKNLVKHFSDQDNLDSLSPFIQQQPNSYNRTWIHRICDYYSLKSRTEDGAIHVKFCNDFKVPSIGFGQFLQKVL